MNAKAPDNVYDAQRDAYFQQYVLPEALKAGESPTYARENFWKASERPGKSAMPRTALVGATALKALTAPLGILMDPETARNFKASSEEMEHEAALEATRQGASTLPYQMLGEVLGTAPYWVGGMGLAKGAMGAGRAAMIARGTSETAAKIVTEAAAGAAIQGAYDAAKADEGHRLVEGLQGAAIGGAAVAGFMSVGPLRRLLAKQHGLPEEVADAVEASAKGMETPPQAAMSANALAARPEIQQTIQQWVAEQVKMAKKAGMPKEGMLAEPGGKVKVALRTADGKVYNVGGATGVDVKDIELLVKRAAPHLEAGAEITSVTGDPQALNLLYRQFDKINGARGMYDVPMPLGNVGKAAGVTVKVKPGQGVGEPGFLEGYKERRIAREAEAGPAGRPAEVPSPQAVKPTPSAGSATPTTAPAEKGIDWDGEQWFKSANGWYATESGRSLPEWKLLEEAFPEGEALAAAKAAPPPDLPTPPSEALEVLPGGKVRDKGTGEIFDNAYQALAARGVVEKDIAAYPQLSSLPDGRVFNMETGLSYTSLDEAVMALARKGKPMGKRPYAPEGEATLADAPTAYDYRERPTHIREIVEDAGDGLSGFSIARPGVKPKIVYARDDLNPALIFHETLHGHLGTLGLDKDFTILESLGGHWTKMVRAMSGAWDSGTRAMYESEGHVAEEVYAYLSAAIRTNDEAVLQRFIAADGGRAEVMRWTAETTDLILGGASKLPDSVHKRVLERKLGEVYRRSTGELRGLTKDTADVFGADVDILNGKYVVRTPEGKMHHFNEREEVASFLERNYQEPLGAPNLVDETVLSAATPRYARNIPPHSLGRMPAQTDPPPVSVMEGPGAEKLGASLLSFFIRPFYPWLDTVATKLGRPDLYEGFKGLDVKILQRDAMIERFENPLKRAIVGKGLFEMKYPPARQKDLYTYVQAAGPHKGFVESQLHITAAEKADIAALERDVLDPLLAETGLDFRKYVQEIAPLIRRTLDPEALKVSGSLTRRDVDFWKNAIIKGEIDPFDKDLLRTVHSFIRLTAREKTIGPDIERLAKVVNERLPDGNYRVGTLRPLLNRQLEYIKGRPDYTQRLLDGATQAGINLINEGIGQVNKALPPKLKIDAIEAIPQDVLGRWILYSYAGGLALRPMVVVRDSMQLFLTTFPILGGKYMKRGFEKAFPATKEGIASDAWRIADQYGALMKQSDLQNLYSGGYESLAAGGKMTSRVTNFAEWSLKWLQWSNNSNRLVTFWGHSERNFDALAKNVPSQNKAGLIKDAGWQHLDDHLRDALVEEAMGADANKWRDLAHRAAKELTDISQWNYRRGASPGIYKYSMGRLFGQYGTWPLNYIEYARRLATKGDAADKTAALTRLAIAHGAVLKTGEAFGVDTGQWVFTQPMAYGGSPLFQAVTSVPGTMDFESYRGMEARREVQRIFWPMEVPGGLAAERIWKAISEDSPTKLQEALGFAPLKPGEEDKGLHALIPGGR
jgi:hypothetical protein